MANKRNFSIFFTGVMLVMLIGLLLLDGDEAPEVTDAVQSIDTPEASPSP